MDKRRVCAGIVLFNPDLKRLELVIDSISEQVHEVVAVDNGSENYDSLSRALADYPNVSIISNKNNEGISKALNHMCCYAHERQYEWILTLDQDTICPSQMIEELIPFTAPDNIGIVCPAVFYEGWGKTTQNTEKKSEFIPACMTSGSLTRLSAWEKVKGFEEEFFMDYVDNEFCMRLGLAGYKVLRVNNCVMNHQLGETSEVTFLGRKFVGVTHNPIRCYYRMHNNLFFIKKYRKYLNLFREYGKVLKVFWGELFYSQTKGKTFLFLLRGVRDGLLGKTNNYR